MGFLKRKKQSGNVGSEPVHNRPMIAKIPIIGELLEIGPLIPKFLEIFKDNRGKMSSKRFGAGALVAAGIAMVGAGADANNGLQFWGGFGLCFLGVVLFGLTRWDGGRNDPPDDPPIIAAS